MNTRTPSSRNNHIFVVVTNNIPETNIPPFLKGLSSHRAIKIPKSLDCSSVCFFENVLFYENIHISPNQGDESDFF